MDSCGGIAMHRVVPRVLAAGTLLLAVAGCGAQKTANPSGSGHLAKGAAQTLWLPNHRLDAIGSPNLLNFVDPEHGWKLVELQGAMGSEAVKVYATSDGGRTWTLHSQADFQNPSSQVPFPQTPPPGVIPVNGDKNGLSFSGPRTGWLTGFSPNTPGKALVYVTHDGGRSWRWVHLAIPAVDRSAVLSVSPPAFFSKSSGILPVTFTLAPDRFRYALYATSDGGRTWSGPYAGLGRGHSGPLSWAFVAADRGEVRIGNSAWQTTDGGLTWRRVTGNSAHLVAAPPLGSVHMFTVQNGWAISQPGTSGTQLLTTRDGGQTWTNITPAAISPQSMILAHFQSPNLGWVAALRPDVSMTVYQTVDGGHAWSKGVTFPVRYGDGNGRIAFANARDGWIEVLTAGNGALQAQLFATSDGGRTWSPVSTTGAQRGQMPFGGDITFRSATTGYLTGAPRASGGPGVRTWLYRTTDGGRTWIHQRLTYPADLSSGLVAVEKPSFFGQQGFLPVAVSKGLGEQMLLYQTLDGGKTWSLAYRFPNGFLHFVFATAYSGWAYEGAVLYRTQDGGRTWSLLPGNAILPGPSQGFYSSRLSFANDQDGWFLFQNLRSGATQLLTTGDGGFTWQALDPRTPAVSAP